LRIFNAQGQELAFNDNAAAPGETQVGFDAYIRFTFPTTGTFFVGVSNANNTLYNAVTGDGDTAGGFNSIGDYQLTIQRINVVLDAGNTLSTATAVGTVTTTPITINASITPDTDIDVYSFSAFAGQTVDFDIDTATNGP